MSPHSLGDWYSLFGLIAIFLTFFVWVINVWIIKPLTNSINDLSAKVDGIGGNADIVHGRLDARLDRHEIKLTRHEEELKTLFKRTGDDK